MSQKAEVKPPKTTEWVEYEYASDVTLAEVLELVNRERRTGELKIHVSQGRPLKLVWKAKK